MRFISFCDENGRNALIGLKKYGTAQKAVYTADASRYENRKYVKSTVETEYEAILASSGNNPRSAAESILNGDPEIDLYLEGLCGPDLSQVYLNQNNEVARNVRFEERVFNPDQSLREKHPFVKNEANVQNETLPIRMSGVTIPVIEAFRRYVFVQHYQLFHTNGLTFDFLHSIAKRLYDGNEMMFVGAGGNGREPIVLIQGGKKYRGFLSGQVMDAALGGSDSYILSLHLTEIDLEDC